MADDKNKSIDDVLSESEIAEAHAEWEHDIRRHFKPLGELGADWLPAPPPLRRSLLTLAGKPFIPLGKVGLVAGPRGVKTQFLTQLAVSVATGKPLIIGSDVLWHRRVGDRGVGPRGDLGVEDCGKVLLALGEEDADEMRQRIYYTGQSLELTQRERTALEASLYPLPLCGRDVQLLRSLGKHADDRLLESNFCLGLREVLEQHAGPNGWRCIILDPASRFMGSNIEADNHAATQFIQCLERLTETAGTPTVLIGHHTKCLDLVVESLGLELFRWTAADINNSSWCRERTT